MVADVSVTRMGARGGETGQTVRQGDREREKDRERRKEGDVKETVNRNWKAKWEREELID